MKPVIFEFDLFGRHLAFHSYGLMIGLAFLLWAWLCRRAARRDGELRLARGMTPSLMVLVAAMFLGGKGLYLLTVLGDDRAGRDLATGFVFWGAIIVATPAMILRLRALGVPVLRGLDVFAAATPAAHAVGRVGCFLAGCCYGHRCDLPWAVTFREGVGLHDQPLHPVQLYEALLLVLLWLGLEYGLRPRRRADGELLFGYFAGYSVVRYVTELFRGDPGRRFVFGGADLAPGDPPEGLSTSVFISAAMLLVGIVGFVLVRRRAGRR
ncbi:MAG: prolipoprotein diacylglyceryl transferase [Planctomycetes bacterium]|nr:prolipoprotein diacylglyceryl transferase [Planctomycetota bacterium]